MPTTKGGGVERRGLLRQSRRVVGEMTLIDTVDRGNGAKWWRERERLKFRRRLVKWRMNVLSVWQASKDSRRTGRRVGINITGVCWQ